jgi:RNA polymerase sigma factor (sigma-70 family)
VLNLFGAVDRGPPPRLVPSVASDHGFGRPGDDLKTTDDSAIFVGLRDSDPAALEALWDKYGARVLGTALNALGDRAAAEEVRQQVFDDIWEQRKKYDPVRSSLEGWVMTIARGRAIDRLRSRRPTADTEELELAVVQATPAAVPSSKMPEPQPEPEPEPAPQPEPEPEPEPQPQPEPEPEPEPEPAPIDPDPEPTPEPPREPEPEPAPVAVSAKRPPEPAEDELPAAVPVPYERRPRALRRRQIRRRISTVLVIVGLIALGVIAFLVFAGDDAGGPEGSAAIALEPVAGAAPGATGSATLDDVGDQVTLEVAELAPSPADRHYALWLFNDQDDVIALSAFSVGSDGSTTISAPVPVEPASYRSLDVTAEPTDGDPRPSGQLILRGPIP